MLQSLSVFFFFNDTATTEIYTLSLHDALPIWSVCRSRTSPACWAKSPRRSARAERTSAPSTMSARSEEHTSELQSQSNLVCRLLLEKKNTKNNYEICAHAIRFITTLIPTATRY